MSKKNLDTSTISNELDEASLFFKGPTISPVQPKILEPQTATERISERTEFRTEIRSEQSNRLPQRRRTTRYSFEFYEDQIWQLKELKHRAEMNGEKLTLSDLARNALDKYLEEKRS